MFEPGPRYGSRQRPFHLKCKHCGREFRSTRFDATMCSARCRKGEERLRAKAAALAQLVSSNAPIAKARKEGAK